jgi:uncharacterized phage-like protein YoqJ
MTGDFPVFAALKAAIREQIIQLIETGNVRTFICGMALGIDTVCCEIVLELKQIYPGLTLQAALPCSTQDVKWSNANRDCYREFSANATAFTFKARNIQTPVCLSATTIWLTTAIFCSPCGQAQTAARQKP